jgi:hypothetical protein
MREQSSAILFHPSRKMKQVFALNITPKQCAGRTAVRFFRTELPEVGKG